MISRILQFIREAWNKMIGKEDISKQLGIDVEVNTEMVNNIQIWTDMYEDNASWLSDAHVYSLNLPASIANEITRVATLEMEVTIEGSARADFIAAQFKKVSNKLREGLEIGCAKGGLMLKPYIDGEEITVDFIHADQFFPVSFNNDGKIIACIFVDQKKRGSYFFTRLEYHSLEDVETESGVRPGYKVINKAFRSDNEDVLGNPISLEDLDEWADLEEEVTLADVEKPLFAYFRYPMANNIDSASPLGVSCYSRAVDQIEKADKIWSDFLWEFESGKRALFVDITALGRDDNSKPLLPTKRLYEFLDMAGGVGDEFFEEWSPKLRREEYEKAIDFVLKKIEFNTGLAYGILSNPQVVEKTAEEIKGSKQRFYTTITDVQKALEEALEELFYAMDIWVTLSDLPIAAGKVTVTYYFDDSVLVNKEKQREQDRADVGSRLMSPIEYRMRTHGEDEAKAKKMLGLIPEPTLDDVFP